MNKMAVALAADSAVTGRHKIYNSVNKLFQLSEVDPVGVMVYGGAEFMGVPWETIIKSYRAENRKNSFPTLEEYRADFVSHLTTNPLLSSPQQCSDFVQRSVYGLLAPLEKSCRTLAAPIGRTLNDVIRQFVENEHTAKLMSACGPLSTLPANFSHNLEIQSGTEMDDLTQRLFHRYNISAQTVAAIRSYCIECLARDFFPEYSGVVVAGFGSAEIFPSLAEAVTHGNPLPATLRWRQGNEVRITHQNQGSISSFAQKEMVTSFMKGIHPNVSTLLNTYMRNALTQYENAVLGSLRSQQRHRLSPLLQQASQEFVKNWETELVNHQLETHVSPIIDTVQMLPKDELAAMAESLVNLTVLKRRVSTDRETVGGPIDVAVISKGDGFIWIKRKHYFNRDLNPRYFDSR